MRRRLAGSVVVGMAIAASVAAAQDPATTFRSGVDLVALTVVATDARDHFVPGLKASDFAVYEDGVQQDVSYFAASAVPIDLALLLDTSASMADKIDTVEQAAIGFASTLKPNDRIMVVDIKDAVKVAHPLDSDIAGARAAIKTSIARGSTALYNGLYLTLKEMVKARRADGDVRRQAIAVLTDGDDTASLVDFDDVMAVAKQSGISVYTITLRTPSAVDAYRGVHKSPFSESNFSMRELAQETGARAFFPTQISDLAGVYGMIADELANQYALGYTSKNPRHDGAYRHLVVKVSTPGIRIRARAGYVAPVAPSQVTSQKSQVTSQKSEDVVTWNL